MKVLALALLALTHVGPIDAPSAVSAARVQARREGKNVMVVFHASWCGWCKKFDRMLEDENLKPQFEKSYVIVHLDVLESPDKKALENPGGGEMMASLGGKGAGLPFFAIVSPGGKKLGDSLMKPGDVKSNTGHPSEPPEIAHFMDLLRATAGRMVDTDRSRVEAYLKADAAKR